MAGGGFGLEVIVTGDEILYGRITDTNSAWIARRAAELGARMRRVTSVGDDVEEIATVLREALSRGCDMIVFTGGLGPSEDDVTVEAIGVAVEREVVLDGEAVERIRRSYEERGIQSTSRGERMARVLVGSTALSNPVGMSTGMLLREGGTAILTFPGIPAEMTAMFDVHAAPLIEEGASSRFAARTVMAHVVFRDFFPVYRAMQKDYPDVYIKNAATPPASPVVRLMEAEIKVDLVVEGATREESEARLDEVLAEFDSRLGAFGGRIIEE